MSALICFDLIEDCDMLAELNSCAREWGELLVCGRCNDPAEVIVGLMVFKPTDFTVVLCGPCWQELPQAAYLA
jgi:hypothetical protein